MFHTGKAVYEEIHRPKCLYEINEQKHALNIWYPSVSLTAKPAFEIDNDNLKFQGISY